MVNQLLIYSTFSNCLPDNQLLSTSFSSLKLRIFGQAEWVCQMPAAQQLVELLPQLLFLKMLNLVHDIPQQQYNTSGFLFQPSKSAGEKH